MPGGLQYPIEHRQVLDRHAADGIAAVWTLPYAHKPGMARELNQAMVALGRDLADHPVEVVVGCTVHVADDDPGAIVAAAADAGAKVAKLHCSVGAFEADDPRLAPVWSTAAERGMPVVIHAGHAVSGHTELDELGPIDRVAARHPDCRVILAHAGHRAHRGALALLDAHPNLYADLTPVVDEPVPLQADDVVARADRLLFGSDAPNTALPAAALLAHIRAWQLPPQVEAAVLGGNARRLVPPS
jgi:predicted TIM-barrel fold metal-dependent hydrolase